MRPACVRRVWQPEWRVCRQVRRQVRPWLVEWRRRSRRRRPRRRRRRELPPRPNCWRMVPAWRAGEEMRPEQGPVCVVEQEGRRVWARVCWAKMLARLRPGRVGWALSPVQLEVVPACWAACPVLPSGWLVWPVPLWEEWERLALESVRPGWFPRHLPPR